MLLLNLNFSGLCKQNPFCNLLSIIPPKQQQEEKLEYLIPLSGLGRGAQEFLCYLSLTSLCPQQEEISAGSQGLILPAQEAFLALPPRPGEREWIGFKE